MAETLLLIDDDELTRLMLGMLLQEDGWTVVSAASGDEALELAGEGVSVVLSDLQMPGLSGAELSSALRERIPAAKLIAMTATVKDAERLGFDSVLQKPVDAVMVRSAVAGAALLAHEKAEGALLDEAVWEKLQRSMGTQQVGALFAFALDDAGKRVGKMRAAAADEDDATLKREAHALKGSAGMIGAQRLQRQASALEAAGLEVDAVVALDEIVMGIEELRSMLAEKVAG